ncbi:alpha/beta hydrolase [Candidatus Kaiserbacteria bacterium]|nr:alpha/beta hydrolase [Candidatus Kaiserbacteria bacterium]
MSFLDKWRPKQTFHQTERHNKPHIEQTSSPELDHRSDFDKQFAVTKRLNVLSFDDPNAEVLDECAEIVHVKPNAPKDNPVFIAPGFLSKAQQYGYTMETLYLDNREVISLNYPKKRSYLELTNEEVALLNKYPVPEDAVRRAITILKVLEHEGAQQVDVVAHSAGAVDTAIAALLHPEKIHNIIFFCPAGLVEQDRTRVIGGVGQYVKNKLYVPKSYVRVPKMTSPPNFKNEPQETDPAPIEITQQSTGLRPSRIKSNPEWLTEARRRPLSALAEGLGLANVDIHSLLRQLHEQGIGLYVIAGEEDPIFPAEIMRKFLQEDIDNGYIDGFSTLYAGHNASAPFGYEARSILRDIHDPDATPRQTLEQVDA